MSEADQAAALASWDGRQHGYSFQRGVRGCMASYICAKRLAEGCHSQFAGLQSESVLNSPGHLLSVNYGHGLTRLLLWRLH